MVAGHGGERRSRVDEFLSTCCATQSAWPRKPTVFDFHVTEGHSRRLTVDADGARSTRVPAPGTPPVAAADEGPGAAGVSVRGTAGGAGLIDLLRAWEPEG
ncbi:hypothetical protein [Streptomyces sp. NPDC060022]|uniref:hypothetical protein n=1 Tax=Streptomyces sp. NPDC060022 TaxID=3347039 RepID=UPI00368BF33E